MKQHTGFSLIEVLLVLALAGLLLALAYPGYTSVMQKARRAEGRTALAVLLTQQEQYLGQHNCYLAFDTPPAGPARAQAGCASAPGEPVSPVAPPVPFATRSGAGGQGAAYRLSAAACPAPEPATSAAPSLSLCVQVQATPLHADPEVGTLRLTSSGAADCSGTRPELCWP